MLGDENEMLGDENEMQGDENEMQKETCIETRELWTRDQRLLFEIVFCSL
jgi:hypothetical protein